MLLFCPYREMVGMVFFFFSSRRRHTRSLCDWSSDVCSSDLLESADPFQDMFLHERHRGIKRHRTRSNQQLGAAFPAELPVQRVSCCAVLTMDHNHKLPALADKSGPYRPRALARG